MFRNTFLHRLIIFCVLVFAPVPVIAVSPIWIAPAGNGVFTLEGAGLLNVAVIDVAISYDSSLLANPRIAQGGLVSGAITAANVTLPGTVNLSIFGSQPVNGNGRIATVSFVRTGESAGRVNSINGNLIDSTGKKIPFSYTLPPDSGSDPLASNGNAADDTPLSLDPSAAKPAGTGGSSQPDTGTGQGAARTLFAGGTLTLPSDETQKRDESKGPVAQLDGEKTSAGKEGASPPPEPPTVVSPRESEATPIAKPVQSVLELFRLYKGERTVGSLTALFAPRDDALFSQEPRLLLADGESSVKVTIFKVSGNKAPNFTLNSARAVSLAVDGGAWLVEAQPDKDALKASIIMLLGGMIQEFPLAVAPVADIDLDRSGRVTEADFLLFLKERGTPAAPKFDLNGDGKRDYLDDYIFTANYLSSHGPIANKKVARQKGANRP
jgi:hypothetical protein